MSKIYQMFAPNRIGHLALNTELLLRRRAAGKEPQDVELMYPFNFPVANYSLLRLIKRAINVLDWKTQAPYVEAKSNEFWEFNIVPPQLSFLEEEEDEGRKFLGDIGIGDKPFICIHDRSPLYLKKLYSNMDYRHHNYRDCDIRNYMKAAEYLTDMGLFVLRMGVWVDRPLETNNSKIIDYARKYRTDFLDIYLSSHCKFFIGATAGLWMVPTSFNVPICSVNHVPFDFTPLRACDLFIPKVPIVGKWNYSQLLDTGIEQFEQGGGPTLRENTPEEIFAVVHEMNSRLDMSWTVKAGDEDRQTEFRALWKPQHRCYNFPGRIGAKFLEEQVICE